MDRSGVRRRRRLDQSAVAHGAAPERRLRRSEFDRRDSRLHARRRQLRRRGPASGRIAFARLAPTPSVRKPHSDLRAARVATLFSANALSHWKARPTAPARRSSVASRRGSHRLCTKSQTRRRRRQRLGHLDRRPRIRPTTSPTSPRWSSTSVRSASAPTRARPDHAPPAPPQWLCMQSHSRAAAARAKLATDFEDIQDSCWPRTAWLCMRSDSGTRGQGSGSAGV